MSKYKKNIPTANVLMTSMRSMGYSFEAALADVIDNSISAHCSRVDIKFPIDPMSCYIAVCDNGDGMTSEELFDAMKYGSEGKQEERAEDDLGRFGLGLKAASLSQCRKLTVISKKLGVCSAYCWDLDIVEKTGDWDLLIYSEEEIASLLFSDYLESCESGTVVIWENFDFIEKNTGNVYSELTKYQAKVSDYLELIFHRFLNHEIKPIDMYINNYRLIGRDPFLTKHKKTNVRRKINIPIMDSKGEEQIITAQPYILPFQKDMSKADKKLVGGIEDYRTNQGFYIYRNERLIIWGTWFGRPRGELTKHARIKVDIPNTLDDIWCIDIKKQKATIPMSIRRQLTKAVDEAMDIAVRVQTYRGRVSNNGTDCVWNRIVNEHDGSYKYQINRESQIFELVKSQVSNSVWNRIEMVLEEIEENVPYQQIYIDKSQNKVSESVLPERLAEIENKARMLITISKSMSDDSEAIIIDRVFEAEPFLHFPQVKQKLLEEV